MNCSRKIWRIGWIQPFLRIILAKYISSVSKKLDKFCPQTEVTTFTFSSVYILLLKKTPSQWSQWTGLSLGNPHLHEDEYQASTNNVPWATLRTASKGFRGVIIYFPPSLRSTVCRMLAAATMRMEDDMEAKNRVKSANKYIFFPSFVLENWRSIVTGSNPKRL